MTNGRIVGTAGRLRAAMSLPKLRLTTIDFCVQTTILRPLMLNRWIGFCYIAVTILMDQIVILMT